MTACSGCGQCCEVITFAFTRDEAAADAGLDARSRHWMLFELEAIGPKTARRRAPWMFSAPMIHLRLDGRPAGPADPIFYYRCRNYDEETHLCTAHDQRPNVCRDYPTYGREVCHPSVNLPPRCSYRADLGQPIEEWQPVAITARHP